MLLKQSPDILVLQENQFKAVAPDALAAIPLKSIPMSWHLPEMPAECQTLHIWLPLMALTLRWHNIVLTLTFYDHDDISESAVTHVIQNTEYFTDTIATMHIVKDAVDADWFVNNRGTSISYAPCDAAFCIPLYKFSDSLSPWFWAFE